MGSNPYLTGAQWRKSSYSGSTGGDCVECAPLAGAAWHKSSHSSSTGGECVECTTVGAAAWHKSTHSTDTGGDCVEVAACTAAVAVRDSKNPEGPVFTVTTDAFATFTTHIRASV
ncbi:DUF397 domain-containing protein [Streptomyces sp. GMY02]|uniref:DUF397 domain-containing protein n=1 Tax=Streptomyces sp. GMY02 TaxID=1333528 RepID=UPI001C2C80D0|nr:DUF397 domain-containing protein [Streptomyces sp. GMY02]QXE37167.1 DUF397 domain-containing protein [Streptomyces sp. GMY02]